MSRIAPDIPELQQVPEELRSIAYTRAVNRAIRSPLTWLLGAVIFGLGIGIGEIEGARLGTIGAVFGTAAGFLLAFLLFFRVILPWRARQLLPSLTNVAELKALDHVRRANDSLQRLAKQIEGQDEPKKPRGPERLPK